MAARVIRTGMGSLKIAGTFVRFACSLCSSAGWSWSAPWTQVKLSTEDSSAQTRLNGLRKPSASHRQLPLSASCEFERWGDHYDLGSVRCENAEVAQVVGHDAGVI